MIISLTPVQSASIAAIGHDPKTHTLAVRWKTNGATYHYSDVSTAEFDALRAAKSIGQHIIGKIIPKKRFVKVD